MRSRPTHSGPDREISPPEEEYEPASRVARKAVSRSDAGEGVHELLAEPPRAAVVDPTARALPSENAAVAYHVGRTLAGRYQIERWIGEGSMGAIVAARHLGLDERVAIKFIRSELRRDPLAIARFAREAKALAQVKSDHVTRVLDVGVSLELGPFIVLEHLEGRDLAQLLHDEGALPAARAVDYILQACEALAAAHRAGIIHRDIKPENLFLARIDEADSIKVLDFGISTGPLEGRIFGGPLSHRKLPDTLLGTPLYMAPERVRNEPTVDQRADIWSLGAVLYELITARTLYVGESPLEICARVLERDPVPMELGAHEASPELAAVIARCLHKDPAARFRDVGELGLALQPFAPAREPFYGRRTQPLRLPVSEPNAATPTATPAPPRSRPLPALGGTALGAPPALSLLPSTLRGRGVHWPSRSSSPILRRWAGFGAAAVIACSVAYAWVASPLPVPRGPAERRLGARPALDPPAPAQTPATNGRRPAMPLEPSDGPTLSARAAVASPVAAAPVAPEATSSSAERSGGVPPERRAAHVPRPALPGRPLETRSARRDATPMPLPVVAEQPAGAPPEPITGRVRLVDATDRVTLVDDHPAVLRGRASRLD
jgi:serine/threonine protein kinase